MARRIQRSPQSAPDRPAGAQAPRSRKGGRVASGQVTQFTVQLATLSEAGIPVVRALTVLEGQARPGPFKDVLGEVTEDVASGMPLSDALGKHPRAFDALYSNMVHAGEAGGVLDLVLQRLAEFREKAEAIRSKLFGAMIYPIIVTCVATVFVAVAVLWLIPKFERIYKSFDFPLPRITTILLDISNFVIHWWYIVFLVPPLLLMLHFLLLRRSDGYRFRMHDWLLRVPLIGSLIQESSSAVSRAPSAPSCRRACRTSIPWRSCATPRRTTCWRMR
ncbi:MAG: type II secretion system F family protein [Planctomycetota bacterium]